MSELIENEAVTEPIEDTVATDEQEATNNAPEAEEIASGSCNTDEVSQKKRRKKQNESAKTFL